MSDEGKNIEEVGDRIEHLLEQIRSSTSPTVGARVDELVHLIVDLYGTGLAKIVALVESDDPAKNELRERFVGEPLIASLLVLHDLHPDGLQRRIERALDEVRPYLGSHAGDVELLGVEGSVARLRLKGNCDGCPSSTTTIKLGIEEAIRKAAPEITTIEVEGHEAPAKASPPLVQLTKKKTGHPPCEICASPIGAEHSHLVCIDDRRLLCVCRACHLLFANDASQGRYRATTDRYVYDASFKLDMAQWDALQVPVGMAFFFFNSTLGRPCAFYPSPAGATESLLELAAWSDLVAANTLLAGLKPDVEALLVRAHLDRTFECFVVPIVDCYALVGEVKLRWKGFDGGQPAHDAIDLFFQELRKKCRNQPTIPEVS